MTKLYLIDVGLNLKKARKKIGMRQIEEGKVLAAEDVISRLREGHEAR